MADAAPSPSIPAQSSRRRRSTKPRVTYRRSPGAVSRPVPRPPASVASRAARWIAPTLKFLGPFPSVLEALFRDVLRNSARAAELQQRTLDDAADAYWWKQLHRTESRRGHARRPRASGSPVIAQRTLPAARPAARPVQSQLTKPNPLAQPAARVEVAPKVAARPAEIPAIRPAARPVSKPRGVPKPVKFSPFSIEIPPPLRAPMTRPPPIESPLLTPFKAPGVASAPNPLTLGRLNLEPQPEPQKCRCRATKPKKAKPGEGYFSVGRTGRESRISWRNGNA